MKGDTVLPFVPDNITTFQTSASTPAEASLVFLQMTWKNVMSCIIVLGKAIHLIHLVYIQLVKHAWLVCK